MSEMNAPFSVGVSKYCPDKDFYVHRPSSLNNPKSNSVMFMTVAYMDRADALRMVVDCLVFWPAEVEVPEDLASRHAVIRTKNPHGDFAGFFHENNIRHLPEKEQEILCEGGAFISRNAKIGENVTIMPMTYIGGEVTIGNNVYIGTGVKIVGRVTIGDHVIIRENAVLGADGLTTDRNDLGWPITIPQFGGIVLEEGVQIGANTVIERGAIDNTRVGAWSKIDCNCLIGHNVQIGRHTFVVGETLMLGSVVVGDRTLISGNVSLLLGTRVGDDCTVGMGAVVVKPVMDGTTVKGNPAR